MGEASNHEKLSRAEASHAVTGLGWRYVLGDFRTEVLTGSLPLAADVAATAWVLADPEGNEACICTWQGRDPAA